MTEDKLLSGYTAHDAAGNPITGTYSGSGSNNGYIETKNDLYVNNSGALDIYCSYDFIDVQGFSDMFIGCIAKVYDSNNSSIESICTLTYGGYSNSKVTFTGNYINSSYRAETLCNSSSLADLDMTTNCVTWIIDPDCVISGRKVDVYIICRR